MKFILLINDKMPNIFSPTNTTSESLEARKVLIIHHFSFYEQLEYHAQFSWAAQLR